MQNFRGRISLKTELEVSSILFEDKLDCEDAVYGICLESCVVTHFCVNEVEHLDSVNFKAAAYLLLLTSKVVGKV
jgi:hypothetical protein